MELDEATRDFLTGPVLIMVAAADAARRSSIGRGMGVIVRSADTLNVLVSRWQWPRVVEHAEGSGRLALTASRASDYLTYQVKGAARVRAAGPEELAASRAYLDTLGEELARLHVPPWISGQWSADREMVAIALHIAEAYVQTPGPMAGTSL